MLLSSIALCMTIISTLFINRGSQALYSRSVKLQTMAGNTNTLL